MNQMTTEVMARWVWATQHPFLHTFIEVSTPTLLLMYVIGRLINAWIDIIKPRNKR